GGDLRHQLNVSFDGQCGNLFECSGHKRIRRELNVLELRRPRFHLLDIEEIVDHRQERPASAGGDGHQLALRFIQRAEALHHVDADDHRGERRAKIVNDHISHVVAEPLDLLEAFVVLLQLLEEDVLPIATALLFQTGTDPRFQQGWVEWLREVIFRASLDTAHYRLHFAHHGDHDHRDVLQLIVGPDVPQDFITVHPRHHYVEKNEVKGHFPH